MKPILPIHPLVFLEECKECKGLTNHQIQFSAYSAIHHKVSVHYWCQTCLEINNYQDLGKKTEVFYMEFSIKDWKDFIRNISIPEDN